MIGPTIVYITAAVWLLCLTALAVYIFIFFRRLTEGVKKGNLVAVLDGVLSAEKKNLDGIKGLKKEIKRIDEEKRLHIQKIGLVRFNPFKEIGGHHSFSLALLDENLDGVVFTGLHTRDRTRVYMKSIQEGKCEVKLSDEEKKALTKARKGK
ncbi:MAG: DUF4446 family protein [Candidatus Woesebacteria bacterium]|jgi:hypothetical protein